MNKPALAFGLVASAALHVWLIWPPSPSAPVDQIVQGDEIVPLRQLVKELEVAPTPPAADSEEAAQVVVAAHIPTEPAPAEAPAPMPAEAPAPMPAEAPAPMPAEAPAPAPAPAPALPAEAQIAQVPVEAPAVVEQPPTMASAEMPVEIESSQLAPVHAPAPITEPVINTPQPETVLAIARPSPILKALETLALQQAAPVIREPVRAPVSPKFPWLHRRGKTMVKAADAIPVRPAPAVSTTRHPPVSPALAISKSTPAISDRGAKRYASPPPQEPIARIAWGDAKSVGRTIETGRLRLVAVDADLKVVGGVEHKDGVWKRTEVPAQLASYSNRVRVVQHVPGFADPAATCVGGEHLAVAVPVGLERRIEDAMSLAARKAGISRQQVAACFGKLVINPTGLEFQIDRIERRTEQ
ncbi:MAG: hypothetical protein EXS01_05075 [Phycisphaerales bacterium]|nr:hypothetical protein [Phycisphaerales bacterium]